MAVEIHEIDGDDVILFNGGSPQAIRVEHGSVANPVTGVGPTVKISRTERLAAADMPDSNLAANEANAALVINSVAAAATHAPQVVGIFGGAKSISTVGAGSDACGIIGVGRVTGSAVGIGIGAYLEGRRDTDTGMCNGVEIRSENRTATHGVFNTSGFSNTTGIWLTANGNDGIRSGVAISIGNPFENQWEVGLGITSQGTGGPILSYTIRDEGSATTSIRISGTHSTAAISIASGSGAVVLGGAGPPQTSTTKLEVLHSAFTDDIVTVGNGATAGGHTTRFRNSSGSGFIAISGSAGEKITGSVAGDFMIYSQSGGKSLLLGGTTKVIQVTAANTLGFFAVTPISRPDVTGSRGANAALASLLTALANLGLVTDSSSA